MNFRNCTVCYNPEIDELIYQTKVALANASKQVVKSLENGYSCDKKAESKVRTLSWLLKALEDENRKRNLGGGCLSLFKLQSLAEKVRKMTASCDLKKRLDLVPKRDNEDSWIAKNPFCVSREKWEKLSYRICKAFSLEISVIKDSADCDLDFKPSVITIEEACNLTFDIMRNIVPCDIVVAISVYESVCDQSMSITRTEEECRLDFELLVTEHKCDITFELYKSLIECNISYDIIATVYENGCSLEVEEGEVMLVSALNKYPINKLNFEGQINPQELKNLGVDIKNSKYLKNPKSFIEKLKSDYGK